jgi:hypothetical protein
LEGIKNICKTWIEKIFAKVKVDDRDAPLNFDDIILPDNPVNQLILYIYTLETFLFGELNNASRNADETKIDTLGPYARILSQILLNSSSKRTDLDLSLMKKFENGVDLYRGTSHTEE